MPDPAPSDAGRSQEGRAAPAAREAMERRRRRDVAAVLPLAGIALLVSPLLDVSNAGTLRGVPVALIYIFAVWFVLIAATARLARRLQTDAGG